LIKLIFDKGYFLGLTKIDILSAKWEIDSKKALDLMNKSCADIEKATLSSPAWHLAHREFDRAMKLCDDADKLLIKIKKMRGT